MAKELLVVRDQDSGDSLLKQSWSIKLGRGITVRLHEANCNGHVVSKDATVAGLAMFDIVLIHQNQDLITAIPIPLNEPVEVEDVMQVGLRVYGQYPPKSQWALGAHLIYEWVQ